LTTTLLGELTPTTFLGLGFVSYFCLVYSSPAFTCVFVSSLQQKPMGERRGSEKGDALEGAPNLPNLGSAVGSMYEVLLLRPEVWSDRREQNSE